ncbi:hypothetical protein MB27_23755 [Actinoplanes utahensis]|uniref:Uncharacterized protein n=2 Tax=Actinoplanes utahensis TaxID=1869 RepID=A0A0A6UIQ1_ACTUT|nr:hypothetical protein MB27_23755 [Actinoplanes utahensis]
MRSETTIGGAVAGSFLLARSETAAVGLSGLVAYPNGFEFTVVAVLRDEDRAGRVFDHVFNRFRGDEPLTPQFLRLGIRFADGGVVTNLSGTPPWDRGADAPMLIGQSGGGGGRRYDMQHWVHPLPPPGPVTFVIEWPAYGITETRATLDGTLIRTAATQAISLW